MEFLIIFFSIIISLSIIGLWAGLTSDVKHNKKSCSKKNPTDISNKIKEFKIMLNPATKKVVLGNIQLLKYCEDQNIDISKLQSCRIERMDNIFYFCMAKKNVVPSMENDIASQPDIVLTMDVSQDEFEFEITKQTSMITSINPDNK